jgi:cyclopropane fatty-acyl-phospholipid synthase-like methyltransferase
MSQEHFSSVILPRVTAAQQRADFDVVCDWVPQGARVLDLGCSDGSLLARLMRDRGCRGYGVEIDDDAVLEATSKAGSRFSVIAASTWSFFRRPCKPRDTPKR